jgi:hypothetical protein
MCVLEPVWQGKFSNRKQIGVFFSFKYFIWHLTKNFYLTIVWIRIRNFFGFGFGQNIRIF